MHLQKMKHEWVPKFKKKGHEQQYQFNEELKDHIKVASRLLSRMKPADELEEATIKAAMEELSQGAKVLAT